MIHLSSPLVVAVALLMSLPALPASADAPAGRFVASRGVVHDNKTNLDWQQVTVTTMFNYANALTYCSMNTPALPAPNTWHLPEIKQLQTLVDDRASVNPPIDGIFSVAQSTYWSSTLYAPGPSNAWAVAGGTTFRSSLSSTYSVRCVR